MNTSIVFRLFNIKLEFKFNTLLLLIFICLFFIYGYNQILFLRPQSIHQWRQADCLQITHNFLHDSWNLFQPAIHNLISDHETTGKSAGEFPILYYLVAFLWNLFGEHEFIYRLLTLSYFILSLFALNKLFNGLLKSNYWSISITTFVFTSPVLVYYANNFLSNIPALSSVFIGWYFFYLFYKHSNTKFLIFAIAMFTLGGLLKMTAYISFVLLSALVVYELIFVKKGNQKIFTPPTHLIYFGVSYVLIAAWYIYAEWFNAQHGGKYTFNSVWPIWEMDSGSIDKAIEFFNGIIFYQIFSPITIWLLIAAFLFLLIDFKKINRFYLSSLILLVIGSGAYVLLWFNALDGHDYYIINLMILPLFILVATIVHLKVNYSKTFNHTITKVCFSALVIFNILYATNNIRMRYWDVFEVNEYINEQLTTTFEKDFWYWTANNNHFKKINHIEHYNRYIGITETDLVIYLPDPSFGISLYLMNQKGWTSFNNINSYEKMLDKVQNKNAKYLFIADTNLKTEPYIAPFLNNKVGEFNDVEIFKFNKEDLNTP